MKNIIIILSIIFTGSVSTQALIINVPANYPTIQAAIYAVNNGDTIVAAPGTYFENINLKKKNIVLTSMYYLNNNTAFISTTILNGNFPVQPDTASVIMISGHQDSTCVIQGFTITGGKGTRWKLEHDLGNFFREGGGIFIGDTSNVVIQNNIILYNNAYDITGVTSAGAGGIRIGDSRVKVINNYFFHNSGRFGTALVLHYCACTIKNNVFSSNFGATTFGGCTIWAECYAAGAQNIIENNTITNNTIITGYCGLYNIGINLIVRNNIIWGNSGGTNSEITGPATLSYNDIENTPGIGNINLNPQFTDSNYVLSSSSPCIDAGDSSGIYNDIQEPAHPGFALYPSRGTIRNDMGGYGGPLTKILSASLIGVSRIGILVPERFEVLQNYPNPFNPVTKIRFDVAKQENIKITIFDELGRMVEVLVNERKSPGTYETTWNASNVSSGIYFYKFESEDYSSVKKMIYLK